MFQENSLGTLFLFRLSIYNKIPQEIKCLDTQLFKKTLKKFFVTKWFYSTTQFTEITKSIIYLNCVVINMSYQIDIKYIIS